MTEDRLMKLAKARERALEVRRQAKAIRMQTELERMKESGEYITKSDAGSLIRERSLIATGAESKIATHDEIAEDFTMDSPVTPTAPAEREQEIPESEITRSKIARSPGEPIPPKIVKKKKKQQVIVEQDSSDDDEFESSDRVIFVKRARARKKTPIAPVVPTASPVVPTAPPVAERPSVPRPSRAIDPYTSNAYASMFSGAFVRRR